MVDAGRRSNGAALMVALCAALLGTACATKPAAKPAAAAAVDVGGPPSVPAGPLDITKLGAKGDGKTDSTQAIMQAWKNACGATGTQKIVIPEGNFLIGALELSGPCTSSIIIRLDGNLLGTGDLNAYKKNWIEFMRVDNFAVNGHGTIDGQGPLVWGKNECNKNYNCKILPNVRHCYIPIESSCSPSPRFLIYPPLIQCRAWCWTT
jgi:galacturan 1,4-alpha-galacturonidase